MSGFQAVLSIMFNRRVIVFFPGDVVSVLPFLTVTRPIFDGSCYLFVTADRSCAFFFFFDVFFIEKTIVRQAADALDPY